MCIAERAVKYCRPSRAFEKNGQNILNALAEEGTQEGLEIDGKNGLWMTLLLPNSSMTLLCDLVRMSEVSQLNFL